MAMKVETALKPVPGVEETPDDFDFELPHFAEAEAGQAWLDSLPHEEAEVDERLKKRVPVTMNLHQLMVDGFDYLARRMGLKSGKDLMYIVLSQYLDVVNAQSDRVSLIFAENQQLVSCRKPRFRTPWTL